MDAKKNVQDINALKFKQVCVPFRPSVVAFAVLVSKREICPSYESAIFGNPHQTHLLLWTSDRVRIHEIHDNHECGSYVFWDTDRRGGLGAIK